MTLASALVCEDPVACFEHLVFFSWWNFSTGFFFSAPSGRIDLRHTSPHRARPPEVYTPASLRRLRDGEELPIPVMERHHVGMFQQGWGENCIQAVAYHKPHPIRPHHEQTAESWGTSQTRVNTHDRGDWINWLYAWRNPNPGKKIKGFRFEPKNKTSLVLSAISAGNASTNPIRWTSRKKAIFNLPEGVGFIPELCEDGLLEQIQLDLGQVISANIRLKYPNNDWSDTNIRFRESTTSY